MSDDAILFEVDDDGVALITLNRPDRMNACSGPMLDGLAEAYRRCDEDDAIRAVVVTGAGRAFCAGADMSDAEATFDVSGSGGIDDFSGRRLRGRPSAFASWWWPRSTDMRSASG